MRHVYYKLVTKEQITDNHRVLASLKLECTKKHSAISLKFNKIFLNQLSTRKYSKGSKDFKCNINLHYYLITTDLLMHSAIKEIRRDLLTNSTFKLFGLNGSEVTFYD